MKLQKIARIYTAAAILVVVLTGCGQIQDGPGASTPGASPTDGSSRSMEGPAAVGLVNLWRVSGVDGERADTWLRFDVHEFQLWRDCGMIQGRWQATDTAFLASTEGASGDCVTGPTLPTVEWLESVTGYREAGQGWELTDARDAVVAELTVDGAPEPISTAADFYAEPPEVTAEGRKEFEPPVPLPAGLVPVTAAELVGRWIPVGGGISTDPHAAFHSDTTWTGSDGCNGAQGRWVVDAEGVLLTTVGASTAIARDEVAVPSMVGQSQRAALDGQHLVLFDADGSEVGRLQPG
ncbi:META domain-containing protein [Arthrobacter sp. H5]|uniref:META domain-containing protein n=1 Tax=Arthrobacter sp. H5 TaxID=1267973 RepID=UPI00048954EA|nr:META domain-containing protein [Arthrobacter sp. H5]